MTGNISVLLVDDHVMVVDVLRDRLQREPNLEVVATASNGNEAIQCVREHGPDVVVMDVVMPGPPSFATAKQIRALRDETSIVFLSGQCTDRYIEDALAIRASGFVMKTEPPQAIVTAIRRAAQGETYYSPEIRKRLVPPGSERTEDEGWAATPLATLTPKEREILQYLARGYSKRQIAEAMHRAYSTIDSHAGRLMAKLDIHDRVELARFAIREGLTDA